MTRLLWLPDVLGEWLRPEGYRVETDPGWENRGDDLPGTPLVVIGHHTATSARAKGNLPTLGMLRNGRPKPNPLPGPLSQIGLGRDGTTVVIASGKANHAGKGTWRGVTTSSRTLGIEAEHPGDGSPWTALQLRAYDLVIAALLDGCHRTASSYCGHREWAVPAGRKPDPRGIDLDAQRARVHALLQRGPRVPKPKPRPAPVPAPTPVIPEADMARRFKKASDPQQYVILGDKVKPLTDPAKAGLLKLGLLPAEAVEVLPDEQVDALLALGQ